MLLTGLLAGAGAISLISLLQRPEEVAARPDDAVLRSAVVDGIEYKLANDGNVFRVIEERGTWTWVDRIFDPEQIARDYVREGDQVFRVDADSGRRYALKKDFREGFEDLSEGADGLRSLIGEERQWTEFTLQSPRTPHVADYVSLRSGILRGDADFEDASVAPSQQHFHSGQQSLKCFAPAKSATMICSKASLGTGFLYFEENDSFWFQAWYRIEGPTRPFTLADLECRDVKESPGIRLMLFDGKLLGVELKALHKPKYQQVAGKTLTFPVDQWVRVTWNVVLHPDHGRIRVWQDDSLVVDGTGPSLPFAGIMYNNLEVGISAHSFGDDAATLFVDDVLVTTSPLIPDP